MEPKTAREWFELLPEQHKEKAINNLKGKDNPKTYKSLHDAIGQAFVWGDSPPDEGYFYWKDVFKQAEHEYHINDIANR